MMTTLQFLLRGAPSELLPEDQSFFRDQAYAAIELRSLNDVQRERIEAVWINGENRPPITDRFRDQPENHSVPGEGLR